MDNLPQEVIDQIVGLLPFASVMPKTPKPKEPATKKLERTDGRSENQTGYDGDDDYDSTTYVDESTGNNDAEERDDEDYEEWWVRFRAIVTLSRKFQYASERYSFRTVRFASNEINEFQTVIASPRRIGLVQKIQFHIRLSRYSQDPDHPALFETDDDRKKNDKTATDALVSLFTILARWPADKKVALHISIDSFSDRDPRLRHLRRFSYVRVMDSPSLLSVPCIRSFNVVPNVFSRRFRQLSAVSALHLAAKMPNLEEITFEHEEPSPFQTLCDQMRTDLVDTISSFRLPGCAKTAVVTMQNGPYCYKQVLPNTLGPGGLGRSIGSAIHHFSDNLTTLDYTGQVDASFFWPYSDSSSDPPRPFWQSMQSLTIHFDASTPSGEWYFKLSNDSAATPRPSPDPVPDHAKRLLPPGFNNSQEDDVLAETARVQWEDQLSTLRKRLSGEIGSGPHPHLADVPRWVANEGVLVPLIESMTKAISQMPRLKDLSLICRRCEPEHGSDVDELWGIVYRAPHCCKPRVDDADGGSPSDNISRPRFYVLGRGWEPRGDHQATQCLVDCTKSTHGSSAILAFLPKKRWGDRVLLEKKLEAYATWHYCCRPFLLKRNDRQSNVL